MPTPIAHTLCGYACYRTAGPGSSRFEWKPALWVMVFANLADLDYLPGFFIGAPNAFHHGMTHSIVFALVAGLVGGFLFSRRTTADRITFIALFTAVYFSHIVLDFFTMDPTPPYGVQLLWPFSHDYFISPVSIFRDIHKGQTTDSFIAGLTDGYNFVTAMIEILILVPVIALIAYWKKRCSRKTTR
jgi:inner membrane protein